MSEEQAAPVEAAAEPGEQPKRRLTWRGSVGMNGHCPYCVTLLGLLLAASLADTITTEVALQRPGYKEGNPIVKFLFGQLGRPAAYAFVLGITVFFALRIHSHTLMASLVALRTAPVINNVLQLWTPEGCPK